jgi:hypothetical protein
MTTRRAFPPASLLLLLVLVHEQGLVSNARAQGLDLCRGVVQDKQADP